MAILVNSINVVEAHERIARWIQKTPCVLDPLLSEKLGAQIFLKLENLQRTGSFKERGALNKLLLLNESEKHFGVVTASAGNHAQAVAYHATQLGIKAVIFMPEHAPQIKVKHTRILGGEVYVHGENYDEAHEAALKYSLESGAFYLHAYNDTSVIAGQGTVGLEILEQLPQVDLILCPVGGGGLISGIAVALENQPIRMMGVQSESMPSMKRALDLNRGPIKLPPTQTFADGIRVRRVGDLTYAICKQLVSEWKLVSEPAIARAMLHLLEESKTVTEGAGAIALAPVLEQQLSDIRGKTICVIVSGGNIDLKLESRKSGQMARLVLTLNEALG